MCASPSVSPPRKLHMYTAVRRHPKGGICTHPLPAPPPKEFAYVRSLFLCRSQRSCLCTQQCVATPRAAYVRTLSLRRPQRSCLSAQLFRVAAKELHLCTEVRRHPIGRHMYAPSPCAASEGGA